MKVKEDSEKARLKLNIQKIKILACCPPGHLFDLGVESKSLTSLALAVGSLPFMTWEAHIYPCICVLE